MVSFPAALYPPFGWVSFDILNHRNPNQPAVRYGFSLKLITRHPAATQMIVGSSLKCHNVAFNLLGRKKRGKFRIGKQSHDLFSQSELLTEMDDWNYGEVKPIDWHFWENF